MLSAKSQQKELKHRNGVVTSNSALELYRKCYEPVKKRRSTWSVLLITGNDSPATLALHHLRARALAASGKNNQLEGNKCTVLEETGFKGRA